MPTKKHNIAIIGGGPAGLMAAEILANAGMAVTVYDHKPSLGRKFLMAGRGGLNLTHSEPFEKFIERYGVKANVLKPVIEKFTPDQLRAWSHELGQETFIGTSGRVFPKTLKASPLLRAWLKRLDDLGVSFVLNRSWRGWDKDSFLVFDDQIKIKPDVTLLALGGGSWAKLGSDGSWVDILKDQGVGVSSLQPSNCGFLVNWSDIFKNKFAGQPLKTVTLTYAGQTFPGDIMMSVEGVEGGAIYALSAAMRDDLASGKTVQILIDLKPGLSLDDVKNKLRIPRGGQSFSTFLQKKLGLPPIAINLLRECAGDCSALSPYKLAEIIKALPLTITAPAAIDQSISTAGGIQFDAIDQNFMLKTKPGVFAAGEMLDWEAPTGGYLLQATFSTAVAAANGILSWLKT